MFEQVKKGIRLILAQDRLNGATAALSSQCNSPLDLILASTQLMNRALENSSEITPADRVIQKENL